MNKFQKICVGIVAVLIVVLLFLSVSPSSKLGGVYSQVTKYFPQGIVVGSNGQFNVSATGALASTSPSAGIGYGTGAGCAVTQATNRTTGVTCTGVSGAITTNNTSLAAGAEAEFTVTDTSVAIGDTIIVNIRSGATANTSEAEVVAVTAGTFDIELTNLNASTADTGAAIINFSVIKAVSS